MQTQSSAAGRNWRLWFLFALWCCATLAVLLRHEPWRDEADGWLVARDASLAEIWKLMGYAGTPILWYLVELPFAKLGLGYHWQQVIHWPIAAAVAWLVLARAPFHWLTRAALVFSYYFAYEYAIPARGYALTLLCMLLVIQWRGPERRAARTLALVLTANATLFGFFFAVAWLFGDALLWLRKRAKFAPAAFAATFIAWIGTALALWQMLPPADGQKLESLWQPEKFVNAFGKGSVPFGPLWLRCTLAALLAGVTFASARSSMRALATSGVFLALLAYLFACKHTGYVRHWGFLWIAFVVAQWIALLEAHPPRRIAQRVGEVLLAASALAWTIAGARQMLADWNGRYSNAEAMANWLREHELERRPIAAHRADIAEAVLPYFRDLVFEYPELGRSGTYMHWDRIQELSYAVTPTAAALRRRNERPNDAALFLSSAPVANAAALGLRLLHVENEPTCKERGEMFWLYEPSTTR